MEYDIFISYRRKGGENFAGRMFDHLRNRGFNPFMDLEAMKSGRFDSQLYKKIDECKHFLLILSPNSLKRCRSEADWVRKEVEYAIKNKKHIITIQMAGFTFPKKLPDSMEVIRYVQAVLPSPDTFDHTVEKVVSYLQDSSWSVDENDEAITKSRNYIKRRNFVAWLVLLFNISLLLGLVWYISHAYHPYEVDLCSRYDGGTIYYIMLMLEML